MYTAQAARALVANRRRAYVREVMNDEKHDDPAHKPQLGFWESLSKEPPREGDKLKAVLFGAGSAIVFGIVAWLLLHQNTMPIQ